MMLAMLNGRSWDDWIAEYEQGHQHPMNRKTHTLGIPMIILSLPLFLVAFAWHKALWAALGLFVAGWTGSSSGMRLKESRRSF